MGDIHYGTIMSKDGTFLPTPNYEMRNVGEAIAPIVAKLPSQITVHIEARRPSGVILRLCYEHDGRDYPVGIYTGNRTFKPLQLVGLDGNDAIYTLLNLCQESTVFYTEFMGKGIAFQFDLQAGKLGTRQCGSIT